MKRILILALIIMILFSILGLFPKAVIGDVEITGVEINPSELDKPAEFKIFFKPHTVIDANGTIGIQFPIECLLPDTIQVNYVNISHYTYSQSPINVQVIKSQNLVVLTIPSGILALEPTVITFYLAANIRTPQLPSSYTLSMWTSSELAPVSYPFTIGTSLGNKVSSLQAVVTPWDGGANAEYYLSFDVTQEGALISQNNDYVDVYFPKGTTFPTKIEPSKVLMKYQQCEHIEIDKQRVRVYIPSSLFIAPGASCNIQFLKEFGIKNALIPGFYSIQVATSKDTGIAVSSPFQIVGTQILSATLSVDPLNQLSPAKYTIKFRTSQTKKLTANSDQIFVEFPKDVFLPSNIIPGAILVNNSPCVTVSLNSQTLQITTPINIYGNSDVTVEINTSFGIKNPSTTGDYTVKVYTMTDSMPVSLSFTVTSSTISKPAVVLSSTSAGQVSKYTITFTTGTSGELLAGIDKINIIFPIGTTMPSLIQTSSITVNNIPTTSAEVNGTTVTITAPITIPANSSITVVIFESANLKNPVQGGSYMLFVNTSKEQSSIQSSPYAISPTPVTSSLVSPAQPDGLNGLYVTQPKIMLSSVSAIDPNPTIYYYFDNNTPTVFAGTPISVSEGVHTFYYYAVDNQGHQEKTSSMQFKVDTIPPQLTVTFPQDNAILNNKNISLSGFVDAGSTVKVNGVLATVDPTGQFSIDVEISQASEVIIVMAMDLAGNSTQITLKVSLDLTPPSLEITSPVPFQEIHSLPLIVQGKTEKGALVTANGIPATVNLDGSFSCVLNSLSDSDISLIEVIAKDVAGNATKRTVNVKYVRTTIIKLQIGNKNAIVNTSTLTLPVSPVIKNNRTFVPLRFVSEAFGAEVTWDGIFKIVEIKLGDKEIKLQIGKNYAVYNGEQVALDATPFIQSGSTLVPIRFVSELLGADVVWDGTTKTATIIYPKQ